MNHLQYVCRGGWIYWRTESWVRKVRRNWKEEKNSPDNQRDKCLSFAVFNYNSKELVVVIQVPCSFLNTTKNPCPFNSMTAAVPSLFLLPNLDSSMCTVLPSPPIMLSQWRIIIDTICRKYTHHIVQVSFETPLEIRTCFHDSWQTYACAISKILFKGTLHFQ